jgi:hypothetical protein
VFDLERAHERGDATGGGHVHALHQAENQAGAIRVAAAGRVDAVRGSLGRC